MKWILTLLTLFAIGCYQQPQVQYIPMPTEKDTPPPTIITVPEHQPQPQRPIIIQPFRRDHEINRHGSNEQPPALQPSSPNEQRTFFHFAALHRPEVPRETLVEISTTPSAAPSQISTAATVSAEVCSSPSERPKHCLRAGHRNSLKERLCERTHRSRR